jgi:hypothetical protein
MHEPLHEGYGKGRKMEAKEMAKRLSQATGSLFVTRKELAVAMGRTDSHQVDWILSGLERTKVGKLYYVGDIAEKITSETEVKQ